MASKPGKDDRLLSVSIMAGPALGAAIEILARAGTERVTVFQAPPGAQPEELIRRLNGIAEKGDTNHLVIPCEEERPVMAYASLFLEHESLPALAKTCRLTRVAFAIDSDTVVGGGSCFLAEQLEFVSDIFVQPASDHQSFELARSIASALNPRASVSSLTETAIGNWTANSDSSFDFDSAVNSARWRQLLDGSSAPPNDQRVVAFGYTRRRPFHPERFWRLLQHDFTGVFRAKGFFWLATRMDEVGGLNLAGSEAQCSSAGEWWAARDAATRETEMPERTREQWQEPFGDRRQSFAVMALDTDPNVLQDRLDACLLTDREMEEGEKAWANFADPFPSWSSHVHHHHHHDGECDHEHGEEHECCHH